MLERFAAATGDDRDLVARVEPEANPEPIADIESFGFGSIVVDVDGAISQNPIDIEDDEFDR